MATLVLAAACDQRRIADNDAVYYSWDGERVLCGAGIDERSGNDLDNIREALTRARDRGELLTLYAHDPGDHEGADLPLAKLEAVLAAAAELGLPFITFAELAREPRRGGSAVALTFDDAFVDSWYAVRELLSAYGAKVTFFVTRAHRLSAARVAKLHELADDGHAIEAHSHGHLDAPSYAEAHGPKAWAQAELGAGLQELRALGFAPTTFAYPFGARTSQLDELSLEQVSLVRSLSYFYAVPLLADPCPR